MEKESFTRTDNYKREKKGTVTNQTVTVNTKVFGTNVREDITEKKTVKHRDWRSGYLYQLMTISDEGGGTGGGNDGGNRKYTEIEDEEVPLAAAPKTDDITTVLAAVSLFSAGGLTVLNRKRRDEEE